MTLFLFLSLVIAVAACNSILFGGFGGNLWKKANNSVSGTVSNIRDNPVGALEGAAAGYLTGGAYNLLTGGTGVATLGQFGPVKNGMAYAATGAVAAARAAGNTLPGALATAAIPTLADAGSDDQQGNPALFAQEQARRRAALLANGRRSTFLTGPGGTLGAGQSFAMNQLLGS